MRMSARANPPVSPQYALPPAGPARCLDLTTASPLPGPAEQLEDIPEDPSILSRNKVKAKNNYIKSDYICFACSWGRSSTRRIACRGCAPPPARPNRREAEWTGPPAWSGWCRWAWAAGAPWPGSPTPPSPPPAPSSSSPTSGSSARLYSEIPSSVATSHL